MSPRRLALPVTVSVVLLGGLTAVQDVTFRQKVEGHLTDTASAALAKADIDGAKVRFKGRDGSVTAPSSATARKAGTLVKGVTGVRDVHAYGPDGDVDLDHAAAGGTKAAGSGGGSATASGSGSGSASASPSADASASAGASTSGDAGASGDASASERASEAASKAAAGGDSGSTKGDGTTSGSSTSGSEQSASDEVTDAERATVKRELAAIPRITFNSDSDTLSTSGKRATEKVAEVLKAHANVDVKIEGFTDSAGSASHGLALSERRAKRVLAELVELGIDADRLSAKGYGETRPLVVEHTAADRARNRRVAFVITN